MQPYWLIHRDIGFILTVFKRSGYCSIHDFVIVRNTKDGMKSTILKKGSQSGRFSVRVLQFLVTTVLFLIFNNVCFVIFLPVLYPILQVLNEFDQFKTRHFNS